MSEMPPKYPVFLPQTPFPMKAGLPQKEPEILARWAKIGLYQQLQEQGTSKPKFILHDGPPYANGHIHIGTAFNKILKDITMRTHRLLGYCVPYIPGWDCHGLPIEWKIEEEYRAKDLSREQVDRTEFRQACRAFAEKWIAAQKVDFQRLGVLADWDKSYATMHFESEAKIVAEINKFLFNGGLYRGFKPVMWSVVEKTALAEAEIEYHDRESTAAYVAFPVVDTKTPALQNTALVIWTTTAWSLPANRAIAYNPELTYAVVEGGPAHTTSVQRWVVAADLLPMVTEKLGITPTLITTLPGTALEKTICHHPLYDQGYTFEVPLLPGDHVTADAGTGLVHTAPSHGLEDFAVGQKFGLDVPELVGEDGVYTTKTPLFAGTHIFKADQPVLAAIEAAGYLMAQHKIVHSYPHSWRSKAPLIYRATPQWFISMSHNQLREKALQAITEVKWVPAQGENRIRAMVETRPDWCLSRQRLWGVPITVFVHKETGEVLKDPAVQQRIVDAVAQEGADAWFNNPPEKFLGSGYNAADYYQVKDITDVWFESGTTHAFVLENNPDLRWPADLYLEGSDQHRGWFQSSLIHACGTRGHAPYKTVLTHGYVLDNQGRKMSKSLGNVVAPSEVIEKVGADMLRLWTAMSDTTDDLRIGSEILKFQEDIYRRFRNTLRYLLGNMAGFSQAEVVPVAEMPGLERWVLHQLSTLNNLARECFEKFDYNTFYAQLHHFCAVDLSAFYFDIRKDSFYCDAPTNLKRRAARTVLTHIFDHLVVWLAPVLCFTAEEAWLCAHNHPEDGSVHLQELPKLHAEWHQPEMAQHWHQWREIRRVITGAIEVARANKQLGSSLQAAVTLYLEATPPTLPMDWAEFTITSNLTIVQSAGPANAYRLAEIPGVAVTVDLAAGEKCPRCWRVLPEVSTQELCHRCDEAIR